MSVFPKAKLALIMTMRALWPRGFFLLASGPNQHKTYRQSFPHMLRLNIV